MHLLASGDMEILVVCDIGAAYCEATVVAALGKLVEVEHFFPRAASCSTNGKSKSSS